MVKHREHNPEYDKNKLNLLYTYDVEKKVWGFLCYTCKLCGFKMKYYNNVDKHRLKCKALALQQKTYVYPKEDPLIVTMDRKVWEQKY